MTSTSSKRTRRRLSCVKLTPLTHEAVLLAWLARITLEGEQPDPRLVEAAADLVETIADRPDGMAGALYRFGNILGSDGWPIAQVSSWLHLLDHHADRRLRRQLNHYSTHTEMARGWADGYVRGAHTGMCIDPTTGLVTAMVLRLRLQEVFEQSAAAAVLPADLHTLVLIDVDLCDLVRIDADLLMACVADTVHGVFCHGETIARAGDRILVLAPNTESTQQRAEVLSDRLQLTTSTRGANTTVLLDPLPAEPSLLDRYLRDLVG